MGPGDAETLADLNLQARYRFAELVFWGGAASPTRRGSKRIVRVVVDEVERPAVPLPRREGD